MATDSKAKVLDGKVIAKEVRAQAAAELAEIKQENPAFQPGLTIVQVEMWGWQHAAFSLTV